MITAQTMRSRLGLDPADGGQDALITELIEQAAAYGRTYCRLRPGEEIPDFLLSQMAAEDYGRLTGAGLSSRTMAGAAESYNGSYSDGVTAVLRSLRHPPTAGRGRGC